MSAINKISQSADSPGVDAYYADNETKNILDAVTFALSFVEAPVYVVGRDRTIMYANKAFLFLFDRTDRSVIGSPESQLKIFEDSSEILSNYIFDGTNQEKENIFESSSAADSGLSSKIYYKDKNSTAHFYRLKASPVKHSQGCNIAVINKLEADNDLLVPQQENKLFELMAELVLMSVIAVDTYGNITYINDYHISNFCNPNRTKKDFIGKNIYELKIHQNEKIKDALNHLLLGNSVRINEIFIEKFANEQFGYIAFRGMPLYENGAVSGGIVVINDISGRKDAENKLKDLLIAQKLSYEITQLRQKEIDGLNQKLEKINADKDRFFSIIAHDLKNPFLGLLGLTKMLSDETEDFNKQDIADTAEAIHDAADKLYKLLENLLEWARLQRNSLSFNPFEFEIASIVDLNINALTPIADQKHIEIVCDIEPTSTIYGDPNMISTVVRNLLSNALKYSESDTKVVVRSYQDNEYTFVEIKDEGTGMSESVLNKLFKIEESVSTPGTAHESGTGLGLVLCKELTDKNNGEISVQSKEGAGSVFLVKFPTQKKI